MLSSTKCGQTRSDAFGTRQNIYDAKVKNIILKKSEVYSIKMQLLNCNLGLQISMECVSMNQHKTIDGVKSKSPLSSFFLTSFKISNNMLLIVMFV